MASVQAWLEEQGLGQYAEAFAENEIDFQLLAELTDDVLEKMGIAVIGHRLKLLRAIAALPQQGVEATPSDAGPVPSTADQPTAPSAERRQLTVMFCDLVGSTALSGALDPEDYRDVMRAYQEACAGVVDRFEGYLAKYLGDGILVYFGYPQAHEDDAERAVLAGLGIVEAIGGLQPRPGLALQVRVGIATGLVVAGDVVGAGVSEARAVSGETPNLAARLQAAAAPGDVVIGEGTRRLVGELFELEDLAPHWREMRGVPRCRKYRTQTFRSGVPGRSRPIAAKRLRELPYRCH